MTPQPTSNAASTARTLRQIPATGDGPGAGTVNTIGIILITAYVVLLTLFSGYLLIKVWPHTIGTPTAAQTTSTTTQPPGDLTGQQPAGGNAASGSQGSQSEQSQPPAPTRSVTEPPPLKPEWIVFFWREEGYWLWDEIRLLVIVMIAGMLGALLHTIRSVFWYVGHRDLRASWVLMYFLLPLTGALLAIAFYFVIRGGFFPQAKADQSNPVGFAALAFLMGLFSAQAGLKLKQVFETIFSPAPQGANARPQTTTTPPPGPPTLSAVSPSTGPVGGGKPVVITGANFSDGLTVSFGGEAATGVTVSDGATINAVTPTHAAGSVDVVVTDKDGRSATLANGFTYEG